MASKPLESDTQSVITVPVQKPATQAHSQSQGNSAQNSPVPKRKNKLKKVFNWLRDNVIPIIDYESTDSDDEEQKQALKEERKLLKNPPIIKPELHLSNLKDNTPGLIGIFNHGNTCFISTIIQCLCNTEELSKYLVTDEYVSDLRESHKAKKRNKFGTKGDLTQQLANLLKSMWLGQYDHRISWFFIHTVMRHGDQYRGYMQHDAQEFLLWMLDNLHEDLKIQLKNTKSYFSKSKNSLPPPGLLGGQHQSNKSQNTIVMQLFHGQFFSSIGCKECGRTSASLESFICLSLPIPQRQIRGLYITIVKHSSPGSQNKKIGMTVPLICTALDIKRQVAVREDIPLEHIVMFDVYTDSYGRILNDNDTMSEVQNRGDFLYAFILPPPEPEPNEGEFEFISLICMNAYMYGHYPRRFTYPFILHVQRDIEMTDIENLVMKRILAKVEAIDIDLLSVIQRLFKIKLVDGMPGKTILNGYDPKPLLAAQTNRPLQKSITGAGQYYLRILLEWENDIKNRIFGRYQELVYEECESVKKTQLFFKKTHRANLTECFHLLMQREELCEEDEWYCSKCKRKRPGIKKLDLFEAPEVLVVHLKRFRQVGYLRQKLDTMIDFPLMDLDLTPHMISKAAAEPYLVCRPLHTGEPLLTDTEGHKSKKKSGKKLKKSNSNTTEPAIPENIPSPPATEVLRVPVGECCSTGNLSTSSYSTDLDSFSHGQCSLLYDLFAVGNHHGGMTGGHYTAFCKNAINGKWYLLDDDFVSEVNEKKVMTPHAYLLFYKRRQTPSPELLTKSTDDISPRLPLKNAVFEPGHWLKKFPVKIIPPNPVETSKSIPPIPSTPARQPMGPALRRSNTAPMSRRRGDEKFPASSFSRKKIEDPQASKFNTTGVSVPTYNITGPVNGTQRAPNPATIAQTPSVPSFMDHGISYTPAATMFHSLPIKKTNSQPNISFHYSPAPVPRSSFISETKV